MPFLALAGLAALAATFIEIDTDARAVLGADGPTAAALDGPEGLRQLLVLTGADAQTRAAAATGLAATFRDHPLVGRIDTGPRAPDPALVAFLWDHRLSLAPPSPEAFETEALAARLDAARAGLGSLAKAPLAGKMLLDPTGSFARLVEGAQTFATDTMMSGESATTIVLSLAPVPFDPERQSALDADLVAFAGARGLDLIAVGPRTVSARISSDIASRARWTGAVGTVLLLVWLVAMLRSARALVFLVIPAAAGLIVASLLVQAAFGSVHVLALGFGGALMGLALDYPLHLMTHARSGAEPDRALRWVLLGALTTAVAFLSLLASGLPAIGQIGLFVATGLLVAAGTCFVLRDRVPHDPVRPLWCSIALPAHRLKLPGMTVLLGALVLALWTMPGTPQTSLLEMPREVRDDLATADRLVGLPSGRHRIEITGTGLADLLTRQDRLRTALDEARGAGEIDRWTMLADLLPDGPVSAVPDGLDRLAGSIGPALQRAGLDPAFGGRIIDAYGDAERPPPTRQELAALLAATELSGLLDARGETFVAPVQLWGVADAGAIAARIAALDDPSIRWVDRSTAMSARLDAIAERVLWCLGLGALAGLLLLALLLGRARPVLNIALGCAAAVAATALIAALTGQSGIFALMALALVVGIGIDYGLFLGLSRGADQTEAATASVGLCAGTTLIAFGVMAVSGVALLGEIGTTVIVGLLAMLMVHAVRDGVAEDRA